jgi:diguanylate cyclase (GGDEF)-like protein
MTRTKPHAASGELVPITDRLRYMQGFRFVLAAVVAVVALLSTGSLETSTAKLGALTGAYVTLSLLTHAAWHFSRRGALALFGFMLMVDGVYLAWVSYATGGAASPLRYLILLHLIAVSLLASYRTGMKLACWHSLLLLVVYYAQQAEVLRPLGEGDGAGIGTPFQQLVGFSLAFWFVAIATASFSAVNERELRRRRYDLESLAAMATRLESCTASEAVAETLLDSVVETFDFERAVLIGGGGDRMSLLAQRGRVSSSAPDERPCEGSVVTVAMATRETQLVSELDEEADSWLAGLLPEARNVVVVPLSAEGRSIGALVAVHAMRAGSRIERRVVSMTERFVSHGALALDNAWLLEQVQRMAATDGLTGVANRSTFQERLGSELARAARAGEDVALLMLDIDHFKQLNDTHGHQVGDQVLQRVARTLKAGLRPYDTAARYGGEEFALVLPRTSRGDGMAIAERIRAALAEMSEEPRVTASVGVANFPVDSTTADGLVGAADAALYQSKRAGRNRVTAAAGGGELQPA